MAKSKISEDAMVRVLSEIKDEEKRKEVAKAIKKYKLTKNTTGIARIHNFYRKTGGDG